MYSHSITVDAFDTAVRCDTTVSNTAVFLSSQQQLSVFHYATLLQKEGQWVCNTVKPKKLPLCAEAKAILTPSGAPLGNPLGKPGTTTLSVLV